MDIFEKMAAAWPAPIVARDQIEKFSGGMLRARTMSNLNSQGLGPKKIKIGRKVGYDLQNLVLWMRDRSGEI